MAEHEKDAAFAGTLTGRVHWELADECQPYQPVRTLWEAEGELTPLGPARAAGSHCVDDRGGGFNGRVLFSAANGDTLRATYTFTVVSESREVLTMRMTGRFADGGSGRFLHASGFFAAVVRAHKVVFPPTVESVWPVDCTLEGRISY